LSAADVVTAIYFYKMRYDPRNPRWPERDRFVLSKGHCVPAQYAALAMLGVFPIEELATLKKLGSRLQGHPASHYLPGLEGCTGSLGQGLSFANGMAFASRIQHTGNKVFCVMGDGETQEGQVWEAAMTSSLHCLGNLTAVVDRNRLKAMDETACGKMMEPYGDRWRGFGWEVKEIDGHDMGQIIEALNWADTNESTPSMIVANTIKGKGLSFIEGKAQYHNGLLTDEQYALAIQELEANLSRLQEEAA
jgi:transketolase